MVALEPESAACAPIGLALVLFRPALLFVGALAHVSARIALHNSQYLPYLLNTCILPISGK